MSSCYVDYTTRSIADLVDYYGLGMLITRINVPPKERGKGAGRKLLSAILADADRTRTTLFLEIVPTGGLTEEQLKAWYERNGFVYWKGVMRRRPRWRSMQENPIYPKARPILKVGDVVMVMKPGQILLDRAVGRVAHIIPEMLVAVLGEGETIFVRFSGGMTKKFKSHELLKSPPGGFQDFQNNPVFGKKRHKYPIGSDVVVDMGWKGEVGDVRKVEAAGEEGTEYFVYTVAFSKPGGVFFSKHWEKELDRVWHRPRFHEGQKIAAFFGGRHKGVIESVWWDKAQKWWMYNVSVEVPPDPRKSVV